MVRRGIGDAPGRPPPNAVEPQQRLVPGERLFGDWRGGEPRTGALVETHLALLAEAIGGDARITVGVWNGYGHLDERLRAAPTLELPGRGYLLFEGSLATLREPDWRRNSGWATIWDETLNLAWPDDRSWFIASEIDFDSTIVGGSRALIDRVLASELETAEVTETSDLSSEGDLVNPAR